MAVRASLGASRGRLVLLVGSGLLPRRFWTLSHVDPGYDTQDIFTFQVAPQRDELVDGPTYAQFHQGFMDRVAGMPGVESVGLFGVLSYVVSNRTREIAVRMALGAEAHRVRRMVALRGVRITAVGVAAGLLTALLSTWVLDSLLFGVGTLHVPTFAGMSAVVLAVAFLASYIPARRASSVDPMQSLRTE